MIDQTQLPLPDFCDENREESINIPQHSPMVVDDFPLNRPIHNGELFIIRNGESRYLTHLFHKYPGKFIPHIPRWVLRRFLSQGSGSVVLDPFMGSGTTLVEAMLHGQQGYGLDIDPLARLIAKVKTTLIDESRLRVLPNQVVNLLGSVNRGAIRPTIPTLNHWFTEEIIEELSIIYEVVESFQEEKDIYDFLLICFSSIIRRASNADNQTMKTYVSHTHLKTPEPARPLFIKTVTEYVDRLIKFRQLISSDQKALFLPKNDARVISDIWHDLALPLVDLIVTSPPYIKSVDYIYNQMAELFWIGHPWGLENQQKQNKFKANYIGSDKVRVNDYAIVKRSGIDQIDQFIERVFKSDKALSFVMWKYFIDMAKHFASVRSIMKPGSHYICIIGDSTLAGISVPTHTLLNIIAAKNGFRMEQEFAYEIRNKYMHFPRGGRGGVVVHDWVLNFVLEE